MNPFNDSETLSAPVEASNVIRLREPVVAVRIHGLGREIELPRKERVTIGSSARCDVVLDDPYTSSVHCSLERRDGGELVVRDRRSKNGTFLNGNRVEVAVVNAGALLSMGRTTLVLIGRSRRGVNTAYERLRGLDPTFRKAVETALQAASTSCSVLILGETGTGKELVARAIHEASPRSARPFVAVNCGAIPRDLIGSELFGHEEGAFTGAIAGRDGCFVRAEGGTLFLDELAELPLEQQPHLLRVLENHTVQRVGGDREEPVDVRLVSATNRVEGLGTRSSRLRLDVYHRIATVVVSLPPLRERAADIPLLVRSFVRELAGERRVQISRTAMRALQRYSWPGNIRELRHAVQRGLALCRGELTAEALLPDESAVPISLGAELSARGGRRSLPPRRPALSEDAPPLPPVDAHIRDLMMDALERFGSVRRAAEALGMPKSTFSDRARRLGIRLVRDTRQ